MTIPLVNYSLEETKKKQLPCASWFFTLHFSIPSVSIISCLYITRISAKEHIQSDLYNQNHAVILSAYPSLCYNRRMKSGDSRGRSTSFFTTAWAWNLVIEWCVWRCVSLKALSISTPPSLQSVRDSHQLHLTFVLLAPSNSVTIRNRKIWRGVRPEH